MERFGIPEGVGVKSVYHHFDADVSGDAAAGFCYGEIPEIYLFSGDHGGDPVTGHFHEIEVIFLKEEIILKKEGQPLLEKLFTNKNWKEGGVKLVFILIAAAVLLLSFDVFTQNKDGRRQVVDQDGGTETELCTILSDIDGAGTVNVMLQYDSDDQITGAIVTAEGAGDPVVKNNLANAVMALFHIQAGSVEVLEKKAVEEQEGSIDE